MFFDIIFFFFFFCKQKTAYEMLSSDWSSDVCSSDRFTASGRTGDEHESRFFLRDFPENAGEVKCFQSGNGGLEPTQNNRKISALAENIHTKACLIAQRITKVAGTAA